MARCLCGAGLFAVLILGSFVSADALRTLRAGECFGDKKHCFTSIGHDRLMQLSPNC